MQVIISLCFSAHDIKMTSCNNQYKNSIKSCILKEGKVENMGLKTNIVNSSFISSPQVIYPHSKRLCRTSSCCLISDGAALSLLISKWYELKSE